MGKNEYVKLWLSYADYFESYSAAEVGRLVLAMIEYRASGVEPEFSGSERFVWPAIRRDIDYSIDILETAQENGKRGGRPAKAKTEENPTKPNQTQRNLNKPNETQANPTKPNQTEKNQGKGKGKGKGKGEGKGNYYPSTYFSVGKEEEHNELAGSNSDGKLVGYYV